MLLEAEERVEDRNVGYDDRIIEGEDVVIVQRDDLKEKADDEE